MAQIVGDRLFKFGGCVFICILLLFMAFFGYDRAKKNLKVTDLQVNHVVNPIGIDDGNPEFTWKLLSTKNIPDDYTKAFQIYVWRDDFISGEKELVWDSGKINEERLMRLDYAGEELKDNSQYEWQVVVWDSHDRKRISDISTFETTYMTQNPFLECEFIQTQGTHEEGLPIFAKKIAIPDKKIAKAYLISSSLGCYDAYINGNRVGRHDERKEDYIYDELKPGWTNYSTSLLYNTYDITSLLNDESENIVAVMVSNGWCLGKIAHETYDYDKPAFIGKILIFYEDGSQEMIVTDSSWKFICDSVVCSADIYDGEIYDSRKWSLKQVSEQRTGFANWENAEVRQYNNLIYHSYYGENVVIQETYSKVAGLNLPVTIRGGESLILDMGQNMSGIPRMELTGEEGTKVELRFAEMLNDSGEEERGNDGPAGSLYRANYRTAESKVIYYCNGEERETYQTTFSYFGYRYIEITPDSNITLYKLDSCYIGIENHSNGMITTDNKKVNQLFNNICWTQRSNWLLIATDCPQRDERLPWIGDLQVYCKTSLYNGTPYQFYKKWCMDAVESQMSDGSFPNLIPYDKITGAGNAGWADAGIIIPYRLWKHYADENFINMMWDSMTNYMDWLQKSDLKGANPTYGDWLAYEGTDAQLVAVAYYARDAKYMSEMAAAIGKRGEAEEYDRLFDKIKDYFTSCYMKDGHLIEQTQTACLLTLEMKLVDEEEKGNIINDLRDLIIKNDYKLSTGFIGTSTLLSTLSDNDMNDLAYKLLLQEENPSWLYSVDQGATTIWERWDSYTKEKGFNENGMNSFNHFAYGSVGEWMYEYMLGIQYNLSDECPIVLQPGILAEDKENSIKECEGYYDSEFGRINVMWKCYDSGWQYSVEIPVNAEAELRLPISKNDNGVFVVNGKKLKVKQLENIKGIDVVKIEGKNIILHLKSGIYSFECAWQ